MTQCAMVEPGALKGWCGGGWMDGGGVGWGQGVMSGQAGKAALPLDRAERTAAQ